MVVGRAEIKRRAREVQIEFFPKGDTTTWDGWCAVKIRVPDETQLLWPPPLLA